MSFFSSIVLLSKTSLSPNSMPAPVSISLARSMAAGFMACGLMNTKAMLVLVLMGPETPAIFWAFSMASLTLRSSMQSKKPVDSPSSSTLGSLDHSTMVSLGMPASSRALPNPSDSMSAPTQFILSNKPSNGDALACTPLSPTLGSESRPRSLYLSRMVRRMEPSGAVAGSVAPRTLPRKSAQDNLSASHSASMYWIFAPS
mmetsp:Transcript_63023/g.104057  ORF Transcript_63023/g.104057 Transcript_63023/m.104057 type:complete len:201 (+) Transcript_63023:1020-1622(+)